MIALILSLIAGIILCAFHVMRIHETEQAVRTEMQQIIRQERKIHTRDIMRLYDEIMELQQELAAATSQAKAAAEVGYRRGRQEQRAETIDAGAFVKAYENQRVHYALKEGR